MVTVYLDPLHEEDVPAGKIPFSKPIGKHCDCGSDLLALAFILRKTIYEGDCSATRTRKIMTSADTNHRERAVSLA